MSTAPVMDGAQAAGRSLQPERWPNGARVAVMLSVDIDNEADPLASGDTSIASLARCQYGARRGMDHILNILDKHGVPAPVIMHPHVTGQRSRALVLDKPIAHMRSRDDVWFATHKQVAEYVLEEQGSD